MLDEKLSEFEQKRFAKVLKTAFSLSRWIVYQIFLENIYKFKKNPKLGVKNAEFKETLSDRLLNSAFSMCTGHL